MFTHVKHMVVTAGPSIIISLIIYAIMGFTVVKGTASMETIDLYMGTLKEFFTISPVMLIPRCAFCSWSSSRCPPSPA